MTCSWGRGATPTFGGQGPAADLGFGSHVQARIPSDTTLLAGHTSQPGWRIRAQAVQKRERVVAGPFLDDLAIYDSIHIAGVPANSSTSRGDAQERSPVGCLNNEANSKGVAFRDDVLLGRSQIR